MSDHGDSGCLRHDARHDDGKGWLVVREQARGYERVKELLDELGVPGTAFSGAYHAGAAERLRWLVDDFAGIDDGIERGRVDTARIERYLLARSLRCMMLRAYWRHHERPAEGTASAAIAAHTRACAMAADELGCTADDIAGAVGAA